MPQWLRSVAARMIADFESASHIAHRSSRGTAREATVVHEFLDRYVPGHVGVVHSGEIRSVSGQVSRQQDIVIVDKMTPPLYRDDSYQVLPIECVYVTGEVKSRLDTGELESAWNSAASVKSMSKDAIRIPRNTVVVGTGGLQAYGRSWNHFPVASFLFATDSIGLRTLAEKLGELRNQTAPEHRIDAVFVLRQGVLGWAGPDQQLQYRPSIDADVLMAECTPERVLMWMQHWLWDIVSDAWRTPLDLRAYVGDLTLATKWGIYQLPSLED